jgi:glycosyltransferase involved in cell wall biosynthesis
MGSAVTCPLVTIVTPTYNRGQLLEETLESVLSQDYPAIEYIVLDDGSTDGTPALLKRYGKRLSAVRHPNMGEHRTVNRGWWMAHGSIIGTVNDDDLLLPGAVREAVHALAEHPDVLVVYPDYAIIDAEAALVGHVTAGEFDCRRMVRNVSCLPGPGAFFRREVLRLVGWRNPRFTYVADCEYWFRVGLAGRMARLPITLAAHRIHPGSLSLSHASEMAGELLELADHVFVRLDLPSPLKALRREALSNTLATTASVVHRTSYFAALPYYWRSLVMDPMAWCRCPPRTLLARLGRMLMPHPLLEPTLAYWRLNRARAVLRRVCPSDRWRTVVVERQARRTRAGDQRWPARAGDLSTG